MTTVLMILTGSDTWTMKDGSPHPTGFWMEEFVRPHKTFSEAGFDVSIATPQGRTPTVDPLSLALQFNHDDQAAVNSQKAYLDSLKSELENPLVLGEVDPADYDVMFVVGGHGPMQDLAVDPDIGRLMLAILCDQNKIVAAVCHGPASFLSAHDAHGNWLFKGRKLTGFSNQEETQSTFAGNAPWLLEDRPPARGRDLRGRTRVDAAPGHRREPRYWPTELLRVGARRCRSPSAAAAGSGLKR